MAVAKINAIFSKTVSIENTESRALDGLTDYTSHRALAYFHSRFGSRVGEVRAAGNL